MSNMFWGIYKNLEREVLNLAEMVHFTDNQSKVYSARIADLLIRCNVEAESLIRELYKREARPATTQVGEMLNSLNNDWKLEKKLVSVISPNMHYSAGYASFCPYLYTNKDTNDFYCAYNAVKHDRANNFERYATIHFLLRSMGALFLLNIYYRNETFQLQNTRTPPDNSLGSSIFAFKTKELNPKYPVTEQPLCSDEELRAVYIVKPTTDSYKQYYQEFGIAFAKQKETLQEAGYIAPKGEGEDEAHQDISYDQVYAIAGKIGGAELVKRISNIELQGNKKYSTLSFEAIPNKFPMVTYLQ
jgi:hypothetical protein